MGSEYDRHGRPKEDRRGRSLNQGSFMSSYRRRKEDGRNDQSEYDRHERPKEDRRGRSLNQGSFMSSYRRRKEDGGNDQKEHSSSHGSYSPRQTGHKTGAGTGGSSVYVSNRHPSTKPGPRPPDPTDSSEPQPFTASDPDGEEK